MNQPFKRPASSPLPGNRDPEWAFLEPAARALGFAAVGVAPAGPVPREAADGFEAWISRGDHAGAAYLERWSQPRFDPAHPGIMDGADAVISAALPYGRGTTEDGFWRWVAAHARGRDYHATLKRKLAELLAAIKDRFPDARARALVDSAPMMERTWAVVAGLGLIGASGALMVPGVGPRVLLGELVLRAVPVPTATPPRDARAEECAGCGRCAAACPTGAITGHGVVDSRRCLSFHTIENRSEVLPEGVAREVTTIFGCDACTSVCPTELHEAPPCALEGISHAVPAPADPSALLRMTDDELRALVSETAMARTGPAALKRNATLAARPRRED